MHLAAVSRLAVRFEKGLRALAMELAMSLSETGELFVTSIR